MVAVIEGFHCSRIYSPVYELVETCNHNVYNEVSVGNTVKDAGMTSLGQPPHLAKNVVKSGIK